MGTTHPSDKGFGLFPFVEVFQETFEKSAAGCLQAFLSKTPARKWMAFSDYAFYAKNKRADVFALSLLPAVSNFDDASDFLQKLSFNDIKSLKYVNPRFITFLRQAPIFNIAVMMPKDRELAHLEERETIMKFFSGLCGMLEDWRVSTPENKAFYERSLKDMKHVMGRIRAGRANMPLIRDSILVASMAGYFMSRVSTMIHTDRLGWFSDRDAMLDYQASALHLPLILQLVHSYHHVLCERAGVPSNGGLILGKPEVPKGGRVFYDSFLRIPDLIAGTLADINLEDHTFTHSKFVPVLDGLLKANDNTCIFMLRDDKAAGRFEAVRLMISATGQDPAQPGRQEMTLDEINQRIAHAHQAVQQIANQTGQMAKVGTATPGNPQYDALMANRLKYMEAAENLVREAQRLLGMDTGSGDRRF